MLLEFSVTCQSDNRFLLVTAAAAERIAEDFLTTEASQFCNAAGRNRVTINNCTESLAAIALMGPEAENVLQSLTDTSLKQTDFRWLSAQSPTVNGIHTTALRVSYIGENGWELYVPAEQQSQLFKTLHNAGKPFDIKPYGAFAMNAMRLEKGYRAWGLDYTTERTPLEAGMNHLVKTDGREFTGRQALLNRAGNQSNTGTETHWSMQLMSIDTTGVDPFYTHTILQNGKPIGVVTSGAYGHRCNTALALGYLRQQPTGDPLNVEILGNPVAATILDQIPYDPTNARLRS